MGRRGSAVASGVVGEGDDQHGARGQRDELSTGIRAGIVAYVVWGLLTIFWKQLSAFDAVELIGWRVLFATVVMAAIVTARGRWSVLTAALRTPTVLARLTLAALLLTANWTCYVIAVTDGRVLETALGYFMAPLGTMVLGIVVLHERPTTLQRLAMACGAVAVVVLTVSYGRPPVLALVIAVSWSLYGLLKRQVPLSAVESLAGETFVLLVPAIAVVAVLAAGSGSIPATATAADWALVTLTGAVTAGPLLLFAVAAQRVPFTILGPLQYLVPTINFLLGWLLYHESIPAVRLLGFALVWLALAATTIDRLRAAAPPEGGVVPRYAPTRTG